MEEQILLDSDCLNIFLTIFIDKNNKINASASIINEQFNYLILVFIIC